MTTLDHPGHAAIALPLVSDIDALTLRVLNERAASSPLPPVSDSGAPIVFVEAGPPRAALEYEREILHTGRITTRPGRRHDLFNALCWIAFPRFKQACNAMHVRCAATEGDAGRGPLRDALTMLDESGVLLLCAEPELAALLEQRAWKMLFHTRRDDVLRSLRFLVCGHALHEKLLDPYAALTGKALLLAAPSTSMDERPDVARNRADAMAADCIRAGVAPAQLPPLPLAGIPGWHAANAAADFYDDESIFRPARAATTPGNAPTLAHNTSAPASVSSAAEP